jgi:hypothetical protein
MYKHPISGDMILAYNWRKLENGEQGKPWNKER